MLVTSSSSESTGLIRLEFASNASYQCYTKLGQVDVVIVPIQCYTDNGIALVTNLKQNEYYYLLLSRLLAFFPLLFQPILPY